MKTIYRVIALFSLTTFLAFDSSAQQTDKTIILNTTIQTGDYIARDWIDLQPGFSYTASDPTLEVSKKVILKWIFTDQPKDWYAYLKINNEPRIQSIPMSSHDLGQFFTSVGNLSTQLSESFPSSDGWLFSFSVNQTQMYAQITITHASDFEYSLDKNYDESSLESEYKPATDGCFEARIDRSLLFPAEYLEEQPDTNRTIDYTLPVGSIPGVFSTSSTGAATYTLPIETLPGNMGMEPQLAIVYNSQAGNGILGMGTNLAGLSAITRTTKTLFTNYSVGGIQFSQSDMLALDGNKLIKKSGTYGSNLSEYGTENETFSKITAFGTTGYGPEWFRVETKDGKTLEYGNTADSRLEAQNINAIAVWNLNKIIDRNGNYVRFIYRKENAESVISKIEYTGNENLQLDPYNTIEFFYDKRLDSTKLYIAGNYINSSLILDAIRIYYEKTFIKDYKFKYNFDNYSRLSEVEVMNGVEEKLNSTLFNWGATNHTVTHPQFTLPPDDFMDIGYSDRIWTGGDVNGDGLSDLISLISREEDDGGGGTVRRSYCQVFHSDLNDNGELIFTKDFPYKILDDWLGIDAINYKSTGSVKNLNGDNTPDIIIPYLNTLGMQDLMIFMNNSGIDGLTRGLVSETSEMPAYTIDDLNNDGIDDIIFVEKIKSGGIFPGQICYLHEDIREWTTFNLNLTSAPKRIFVSDFNADGMKEVMVICNTDYKIFPNVNGQISPTPVFTSDLINSTYEIEPGDFNNDGLLDFLCYKLFNTQEWFIASGYGKWSFLKKPISDIEHDIRHSHDEFVKVLDFNNDGKSDVIVGDRIDEIGDIIERKFYTYWYKNNGSGNFQQVSVAESNYPLLVESGGLTQGDFNGDGREDLVYYGYEFYNQSAQNRLWRIYGAPNITSDEGLVNTILDGYNNKSEIQYLPLTRSVKPDLNEFYVKGLACSYPLNDIQAPLFCVWKSTMPNGYGSFDTTIYSYGNAKIHNKGLGFLGFGEISTENAVINRKTKTTNTLHESFFRIEKQIDSVQTASGDILSKTETDYLISAIGGRYFSGPSLITKTDYLTNSTIVSGFQYEEPGDNFAGNVIANY